MEENEHILEGLEALELCEFNDECDFCQEPEQSQSSYVHIIHWPEDVAEAQWYMCGNCRNEYIEQAKKGPIKDPFSHYP